MSKASAVAAPHQSSSSGKGSFVLDVEKIRADARKHMDEGPVTSSYGADRDVVLKLLNEAPAQ